MIEEPPIPFEQEYPDVAEHLVLVANREHQFIKSIHIGKQTRFTLKRGQRIVSAIQGRNERCACGSGAKYKHCCGK